jgi:hypothetical protein
MIERDFTNIGLCTTEGGFIKKRLYRLKFGRTERTYGCGVYSVVAKTGSEGEHATAFFRVANPHDPRAGDPYLSWQRCVTMFTLQSLTHASDTPPALSVIYDIIHRRTGSKHLAGLW